jgi:hypothetical protein
LPCLVQILGIRMEEVDQLMRWGMTVEVTFNEKK